MDQLHKLQKLVKVTVLWGDLLNKLQCLKYMKVCLSAALGGWRTLLLQLGIEVTDYKVWALAGA